MSDAGEHVIVMGRKDSDPSFEARARQLTQAFPDASGSRAEMVSIAFGNAAAAVGFALLALLLLWLASAHGARVWPISPGIVREPMGTGERILPMALLMGAVAVPFSLMALVDVALWLRRRRLSPFGSWLVFLTAAALSIGGFWAVAFS